MAILEAIESKRITEMIKPCPYIQKSATIEDFMKMLKKQNTSFAAVVDGNRVVGIVSDKHLVKLMKVYPVVSAKYVLKKRVEKEYLKSPVSTIMASKPLVVKEGDSLDQVIHIVAKEDFRFIIVVDVDSRLLGYIPLVDIIERITR